VLGGLFTIVLTSSISPGVLFRIRMSFEWLEGALEYLLSFSSRTSHSFIKIDALTSKKSSVAFFKSEFLLNRGRLARTYRNEWFLVL